MPRSVQKIAGSRTVSKVSAADTAQDGSWQVTDVEWQRKSKGCFTGRMVLPSRDKGPTCRGVCWGEFPPQCSASPGRGLLCAGAALGFRQPKCSWQWQVLSYYLLVLLLPECYSWPALIYIASGYAGKILHGKLFTCLIAIRCLTVASILIYGWIDSSVTPGKCAELRSFEMSEATVDGNAHFACLLDTCVKPGKTFCNNSLGFRKNNSH